MRPQRLVSILSALGITLGLGLAMSGCSGSQDDAAEVVQQHTSSQAPDDVVRNYLDAVQRGDDESAAGLSTPGFAATDDWQHDADPGLKDVDVSSDVVPYDTTGSPAEVKTYEQVVSVPVTFTVTEPDQGFPAGAPTGWGYVLVRHGDDEPWLVAEAGNG